MGTMRTLGAVLLALAGCSPRSESSDASEGVAAPKPVGQPRSARPSAAQKYSEEEIIPAALQSTRARVLGNALPIDPPEARQTSKTLEDLAEREGWLVQPCDGDRCLVMTTRFEVKVPPPERPTSPHRPYGKPIEEVRVLSLNREARCDWVLVARSEEGWLAPIWLGTSARGCRRAVDRAMIDELAPLWLPIAMDAIPGGIRLEGQGTSDPGSMDFEVATTLERVVYTCRFAAAGPDTLACAREATTIAENVPLKALGERALIAPEERWAAWRRQASGGAPVAAPTNALERVGGEQFADWIVGTAPTDALASWMVRASRHVEVAVDAQEALIVSAWQGGYRVSAVPGGADDSTGANGRARLRLDEQTDYSNEAIEVERLERVGETLVVRVKHVNEGPVRVTTRWVDLVRRDRRFRLATGVRLDLNGEEVGEWEREVVVEPEGVRMVGRRGALAWFRGVGRFSWVELERQVPRWQRAFGRAWEASLGEEAPRARGGRYEGEGSETVAPMRLVPGFIEPLSDPVVDDVAVD